MGSYLNSCSLTNQTIREREEVVIVPLFSYTINPDIQSNNNDHSLDFLYENSFKPFPYSFIGEYADYGLYETDEKNTNYKAFKNWLIDNCFIYDKDKKQLNKIISDTSWEDINRASLSNQLICKTVFKFNYFVIKFFVVLKKYYDLLLEESKSYNYWYKKRIKNNFNDVKDILNSVKFEDLRLLDRYFNSEVLYDQYLINMCLSSDKYTFEKKEIIFNNTVNLEAVFRAMSHMNIAVRPTYYVTQDYSNANGIRYQDFMKKVIEISDEELKESDSFYESDFENLEFYKRDLKINDF